MKNIRKCIKILLENLESQEKNSTMGKKYKHLRLGERLQIEVLLKANVKVSEIAKVIGVHRSTIYREIKRGRFTALNPNLTTEERYSPDIADQKYEEHLKEKGVGLKIGNNLAYANEIENLIVDKKYSPATALAVLRKKEKYKISICVTTLYSYIDKNIFFRLTNKKLPVKNKIKREYKKIKRQRRANAGTSIEKRPEQINTREEFGHWEMDTVKGKRGVSKKSLLVLTERKTRKEIILKLKSHTSKEVVSSLNMLEKKWGELFKRVFKTITVDNGTEFSDVVGMETSIFGGKRTKMYYCHPYSSWERGTNEVTNKLIRRHIPKGVSFDRKSKKEIKEIEDWINNYPRRILNYASSNELFEKELSLL